MLVERQLFALIAVRGLRYYVPSMNAPNMVAAIQSANEVIEMAQEIEKPLRSLLQPLWCDTGEALTDQQLGVNLTVIGFITVAAAGVISTFEPGLARTEALQALSRAKLAAERAAAMTRA